MHSPFSLKLRQNSVLNLKDKKYVKVNKNNLEILPMEVIQRGGGADVPLFETKTKSQQRNSTKKRVTGLRFCMAVAL